MQWSNYCGCRGGDGGCGGDSGWENRCGDYPDCVSGDEDALRRTRNARSRKEASEKVKREAGAKREPLMLICTEHPTYRAVLPPRAVCDVCKEIYDLVHTFTTTQIRDALTGALIRNRKDGNNA